MHKAIVFTGIILFLATSLCLAEELTITTYYPSPFGVYNQLNTNTLGVGDTDGISGLTSADAPDPNDPDEVGDVWVAGKVGIGTRNSGAELAIAATHGSSSPVLSLTTPGTSAGHQSVIQWFTRDYDGDGAFETGDKGWHVTGRGNAWEATQANDLIFWKYDSGWQNVLDLDAAGNVGIGTNSPTKKLDVAGKIRMRTQTASGDSADTVVTKGYLNLGIGWYDCPVAGQAVCSTCRGQKIVTTSTCSYNTYGGMTAGPYNPQPICYGTPTIVNCTLVGRLTPP